MSASLNPNVEILDIPNATYFADSLNSVSHSEMDVFRESPALYHGRYIRGEWPQERKVAFDVGTVFHDLVLGPQYVVEFDSFSKMRTVAVWCACSPPERAPDFQSDAGSLYWNFGDHVVRSADHWGTVGTCYWVLRGHGLTGMCPYSHFLASENFVPIPTDVLASDGSRKGNKWKDFAEANQGKISLKEQEFAPLAQMVEAVKAQPFARKLLFDWPGKNEVKLRWTDPETGIVRRGMLDAPRFKENGADYTIIGDLKTMARMPTPEMFSKIAWQYGYHRQCEWYKDGIEALAGERPPFVFIVVLKQPPFTCRVFELSERYCEQARQQNAADLAKFKARREADDWSDDDASVLEVDPPRWAEYTPDWSIPN